MSIYSRILVAVDGSATSERGLREALALAADQQARLVVLNVINDIPLMVEMASAMYLDEGLKQLHQHAGELVQGIRRRAAEVGVEIDPVIVESTGKRVADVVIDTAKLHRCDLIVMGTHGRRGLNRLTLGSDAELVLRAADVPVLIARSGERSHRAASAALAAGITLFQEYCTERVLIALRGLSSPRAPSAPLALIQRKAGWRCGS